MSNGQDSAIKKARKEKERKRKGERVDLNNLKRPPETVDLFSRRNNQIKPKYNRMTVLLPEKEIRSRTFSRPSTSSLQTTQNLTQDTPPVHPSILPLPSSSSSPLAPSSSSCPSLVQRKSTILLQHPLRMTPLLLRNLSASCLRTARSRESEL